MFLRLGDLVNTNPFSPTIKSFSKQTLLNLNHHVYLQNYTPTPVIVLVAKRDQQAAAHVPSERRQSSRTVPFGSPSSRELTVRRFKEEFQQEHLLGHGEFSHVYLCKNRLDCVTYAVKASKQAVLGTSYEQMAWRETCAHAELTAHEAHENLVRYHSAWIESGKFFVQLEYCNNGSLEDILKKHGRNHMFTNEQQLKHILHQISDALSFVSLDTKNRSHLSSRSLFTLFI